MMLKRKGEEQHTPVHANAQVERNRRGQLKRGERLRSPERQKDTQDAAAQAQQALSSSICRCKPAARGAQRQPHGHIALAAGGLRKQKVGHIGAGDGQNQQHDHRKRSQKDQQPFRVVRRQ